MASHQRVIFRTLKLPRFVWLRSCIKLDWLRGTALEIRPGLEETAIHDIWKVPIQFDDFGHSERCEIRWTRLCQIDETRNKAFLLADFINAKRLQSELKESAEALRRETCGKTESDPKRCR